MSNEYRFKKEKMLPHSMSNMWNYIYGPTQYSV